MGWVHDGKCGFNGGKDGFQWGGFWVVVVGSNKVGSLWQRWVSIVWIFL